MANESKSVRLNFWMKKNLVDSIDEYADSVGITRSAAISVLCSYQLQSLDTLRSLGDMSNSINGMNVHLMNKDNG